MLLVTGYIAILFNIPINVIDGQFLRKLKKNESFYIVFYVADFCGRNFGSLQDL